MLSVFPVSPSSQGINGLLPLVCQHHTSQGQGIPLPSPWQAFGLLKKEINPAIQSGGTSLKVEHISDHFKQSVVDSVCVCVRVHVCLMQFYSPS